jgi:hypothetical protein
MANVTTLQPTNGYVCACELAVAQGTIRLGHAPSAVLSALNITNEVFGYYTGSPIFLNQREFYKSNYSGGSRYSFNRER